MAASYDELVAEQAALTDRLSDPALFSDHAALAKVTKAKKRVDATLDTWNALKQVASEVADHQQLVAAEPDSELGQLAATELPDLAAQQDRLQADLEELRLPPDPDADKDVIMEIRAGAGGDEASLFGGELLKMYHQFAESKGFAVELLSSSPSDVGGYKEVVCRIAGDGAFRWFRYEGGTHRVQRIPVTESGGRIHTSTVTVAVLPEAEEVDVEIKPDAIRVDVFRSSGPGGQSVNTTDSAVRITHLPTGITATSQDEKSQHKNKAKAMTILRSRVLAAEQEAAATERGDTRRSQVGTGDRSEKIRTYNFPQDRLTDHRINFTRHGLEKALAGEIDDVVAALQQAAKQSHDS